MNDGIAQPIADLHNCSITELRDMKKAGFPLPLLSLCRYYLAAGASSVLLLLGRLSGSDVNAARHLNSLTKVALQR